MDIETTKIHQPHDGIFRAALSDVRVVQDFLKCYLPEHLLQAIDLNKLEIQQQSYIDRKLSRSESDVLYAAEINNEPAYIYLLMEHWSQSKPLIPFKVYRYNGDIWDAYLKQNPDSKKLPLIINLVFYNGKTPFTGSTDFRELFNAPKKLIEEVWGKPITLIDVNTVSDNIVDSHERAGVLTFFMKHIWARDFLPYLKQIIRKLRELEQTGYTDFVYSLLYYALDKGETGNVDEFIETVKHGLTETAGETIMTMAQQLLEQGKKQGIQIGRDEGRAEGMQQGMQQGIEQGREKGVLEGEYSFLLHLIQRKFHQVPDIYREKMARADANTLLVWGERVLEAESIEDIFI